MTRARRHAAAPVCAVVAILLGAAVGCRRVAVTSAEPSATTPVVPSASLELLVKLAPDAGEALEAALQAGAAATSTGLAWFDALNRRHGVMRLEPIAAHHLDLHTIRRQYPQRSRRAPPSVVRHSAPHLYKLTLPPDADLIQAVAEYQSSPHVEYAQPNYRATIQH